ncbi:saccharopine dehydrogenase NADP-binding domain-containing protein [Amycolatopsis sp. NPDC051903]|uniref:saccharopine dehydrogenase NADP-binding domain-containing protein n=1 Tax=Amycolatopsis sp. NPDC051903 TaxID=3363936 RepID=UPI0037B148A9
MSPVGRVLIVGGYGLVGGWVARHLRAAGHDLELVLGGRRPQAGERLAQELDAKVARVDVGDTAGSLAAIGPADLVVSAVQDPHDDVLRAALRAGAAHIGIVRKVDNVGATALTAAALAQKPALLLGHWQAGVTTYAALMAARRFRHVERIELAALFDPADASGPMTSDDRSAFFTPALLRRGGCWERVEQAASLRTVDRRAQESFTAQPMGVLDVAGLAAVTGAPDVRFDIGTGESAGTAGGGATSHDIYADLRGTGHDGRPAATRFVVSDPLGQAHLTALGVLIGVERILALDGSEPLGPGIHLPERVIDAERAIERLRSFGVRAEHQPYPSVPERQE